MQTHEQRQNQREAVSEIGSVAHWRTPLSSRRAIIRRITAWETKSLFGGTIRPAVRVQVDTMLAKKQTRIRVAKSGANSDDRLSAPLVAPPSEQASAREDQARQASADGGAGNCGWAGNGGRSSKCIVKLEAAGRLATRQIKNQFDILQAAGLKAEVERIIGKESLRVREAYERSLVSQKIIDRHLQHGRIEPRAK
jgi:hypothetical protein